VHLTPDSGRRWLDRVRTALPGQAAQILAIKPKLREALDGSSELWAIVVLDDEIQRLTRDQVGQLLARVEQSLRAAILADAEGNYEVLTPSISFRTASQDRRAGDVL
jgi:hypothetical protein